MKRTLIGLFAALGLSMIAVPAFAEDKPAGETPPAADSGAKPAKKHHKPVKKDDAAKAGEGSKTAAPKAEGSKGRSKRVHRRSSKAAPSTSAPSTTGTPAR